ncbi:MAG: septal ring lytic transglycosylase RlpA family protein [Acidobacteria bacterium]|nr:septal ring lytic transglycosylase RlpA family protein [Acidobacteriota bacterium]MBV9067810.1 septal ring lytic transglycosylase RlpA family protein [Acidobacteriota bacterium]MBV9185163.1 septal ring lytic transglycosylase RlpA family protein [Acidobacteriota bacterium]
MSNLSKNLMLGVVAVGAFVLAEPARAQSFLCEDTFKLDDATMQAYRFGPVVAPPAPAPEPEVNPFKLRILKYASFAMRHRLSGLASYYSTSLDGTLTANGERYHNKQMSAAHLTLPLGSWVEVTARATGRKLRLRVNDRGPYVNKFAIDLSQAAARFLGVDVAEDRFVSIRVIGLPGEEPLPQDVIDGPKAPVIEETAALTPAAK